MQAGERRARIRHRSDTAACASSARGAPPARLSLGQLEACPSLPYRLIRILQAQVLSHLCDADAVVRACTSCRALRALLPPAAPGAGAAAGQPLPFSSSSAHPTPPRPPAVQFRGVRRLAVRACGPSFKAAAAWLPGSFPDLASVDCAPAGHVPEAWLALLLSKLPGLEALSVSGLWAWDGRASLAATDPRARLRRLDARGTALDVCSNDGGWVGRAPALRHLTSLRLGGVDHGLWRCHGHGQLKCAACEVRGWWCCPVLGRIATRRCWQQPGPFARGVHGSGSIAGCKVVACHLRQPAAARDAC